MPTIKTVINPTFNSNQSIVDFVQKVPQTFDHSGMILYDKRNTIKLYNINSNPELQVVVKRYKHPNILQKIIYSFFRKNKAIRAFTNALELERRQINTPQCIACIELRNKGLFNDGYYISGADHSLPIAELLIEPKVFDTILAEDFAAFAAQLHLKGILHHDLNSTNVLFHPLDNGRYEFSVIDINRMTFFQNSSDISKHQCFDNLTRFTGRMDLFNFVLEKYIEKRGWDSSLDLDDAIRIKVKHDEAWRKRKAFLKRFKRKK